MNKSAILLGCRNDGYKEDERVLCIRPPLPEKGALNILVLLSLAIINDMMDKGIVKNCKVQILDLAMNERYPISWYKYFNGRKETTYSKYGFVIRDLNVYDKDYEYFDYYMSEIIPKILNKRMNIMSRDEEFQMLLEEFNLVLKSKRIKRVIFNPTETIGEFLNKVLNTKRVEDYKELLKRLNKRTQFDIRYEWYWSKRYYDKFVNNKVMITNISVEN